ncbi:MAG: hypothetical protein N2643_02885 [Endomicrobia bacterium]|nr:hypothetical protein [Endomicrobiia bacterium]
MFPIVILSLILNILISFKTHPWYISYFNELIGGSKNGWKYFTDSNVDWGQGLKQLSEYLKERNLIDNIIYLSYFGVGDPHYYNIKYRPIGCVSNLTVEERKGNTIAESNFDKVIVAVSVTNLQGTYYKDKKVFNFLKIIKPDYIVADSIFIYDITKKKFQLEKFIGLLTQLNNNEDVYYINKKFLGNLDIN